MTKLYITTLINTEIRDVHSAIIAAGARLALVIDMNQRLVGICTQGDLMRLHPVRGLDPISSAMNTNFVFANVSEPADAIKNKIVELNLLALPILDQDGVLVDVETPWRLLEQSR